MKRTTKVSVAKRENRSRTDANERIVMAGQVHQPSIGTNAIHGEVTI